MVIVMIGILSSILIQKFIDVSEDTEIVAEDSTIDRLRSNLFNVLGQELMQGKAARFPNNPFANLAKVPEGYDRLRTNNPTGEPEDDNLWVFVIGNQTASSGQITPQQAGTTLDNFQVDGFIYHQRRDHTVVRWAYDSTNGVISKKFIVDPSELKNQRDRDKQQRGDIIKDRQLPRTR